MNLSDYSFDINIEKFNFVESYSKFRLRDISLELKLDTTGCKINDFNIKTNDIDLSIDAELKSINVFSENADFENSKFILKAFAKKTGLEDISKFLPSEIPINGLFKFDLNAEGSLKNFNVKVKELNFGNSKLKFSTNLKNVTEDYREIKFVTDDTYIVEGDINNLLKPLKIDAIPNFSEAKIDNLKAFYSSDSLYSEFSLKTSLGDVSGFVNLNMNDIMSYSGSIKTKKFNLAKALKDNSLQSDLNSNIAFSGKGFNPEDMLLNLKLDLTNSSFIGYSFSKITLDFNTSEKGYFVVDSLFVELARKYDSINVQRNSRPNQSIFVSGYLDIKNPNNPKYSLLTKINSFRPARFFDNQSLPSVVNATMTINGQGLNPEEIVGDVNIAIDRWRFARKQLKPLDLKLKIQHPTSEEKLISMQSDILNFEANGKFTFNSLTELLSYNLMKLNDYVNEKIVPIVADNINFESGSIQLNQPTDNIDMNLKLELKDIEYIKAFMGFDEFKINMNMDLGLISNNNGCTLNINQLKMENFIFKDSLQSIRFSPLSLKGDIALNYSNNYHPEFNLSLISNDAIFIDKNFITNLQSDIAFKNDNLSFSGSAGFNDQLEFSTDFNSSFTGRRIDLIIDSLFIKYSDKLNLSISEKANLSYQNETIDIQSFKLTGKDFKSLELSGKASMDKFDDLSIKLIDYNIDEIWKFLSVEYNEYSEMFKGKIDSLSILVNGSMANTDINVNLATADMHINGNKLGNLTAVLIHRNSVLSGNIEAFYMANSEKRILLNAELKKIPVNLSIDTDEERFSENKPIDLSLEMKRFPLAYISPFVSGIKELRGFADINLEITGKDLNSVEYNGFVNYDKTEFLLELNNMNYTSEGKIIINTGKINIEKISLMNDNSDLSGGEVIVSGDLTLDNLEPQYMNINISSKKFKLLSQASMKSMPTMYGDFIISLGPKPLRIFGSIDEPNISGDLNILRATLNMPNAASTDIKKSRLKYEFIDNENVSFTYIDDPSTKPSGRVEVKKEIEKSNAFTNQLDIDIGIKFLGRFIVTMDITNMGQLFAEIGTETTEDVLRYVQTRGSDEPKIYGTDIIVKSGSTLKLIKMFDTKGTISFPTGLIDNPGLDLSAVYNGQRTVSDVTRPYTVNMYIKGTKDAPIITFGYSDNGMEAFGDASKINEDALLLLTFGKTKEDFENSSPGATSNLQKNAGQIATNLGSSMASSFASSAMTDFLQTTGFIQNIEIDIGNSLTSFDQTRLKWSGDIYGIKYTLGGTVADFANNNEISFDFPLIVNSNINWLNQFVIQLTKISNTNQASTSINQKDWEVKLKIGGSW
jgi:hypothetical protein